MRIRRFAGAMGTIATTLALGLMSAGCGCGSGGGGVATSQPLRADIVLLDENPGSATYLQGVSPDQLATGISAWYFGDATSAYSAGQIAFLDALYADPDLAGLPRPVHVLGVNAPGSEAGTAAITAGRALPWLQETPAASLRGAWQAGAEEVLILDTEGRVAATYDVGANDLGIPSNYAALKGLLFHVAATSP